MIDPTTSATTTAQRKTAQSETAPNEAVLSSDFETFLRMLTTQMQNQDPLNPVDATDYATQLATFSSVEQQVLTNDLLAGLSTQLAGNAFQQMAGWVGMEALARAPVAYDGSPVELRPDVADGADGARLMVYDETGTAIYSEQLDILDPFLTWTGEDLNGNPVPPGLYSFEIESFAGDEQISSHTALAYNRIEEVRDEGGLVYLTLADGSLIDASTVSGLRAPEA